MHWIKRVLRRTLNVTIEKVRLKHAEGHLTRAMKLANQDAEFSDLSSHQRFSMGTRPVIRWIKGDGLDDEVTRVAIAQATRLFGSDVDYCLCTVGVTAERVRHILESAVQPVEWRPVSPDDNLTLARYLIRAGCIPSKFGYWWKWFPERVRPDAPEWILDGDMVLTGKPSWYADWLKGKDGIRVTQDDRYSPEHMYGQYLGVVDLDLKLYSGLISLPPGVSYMPFMEEVFSQQPLQPEHNGQRDMSEQGVIAATFQKMQPIPIPLYEFPFARAFEDFIDFGLQGDSGQSWGYHFGNAFRMANPHFERLVAQGMLFSKGKQPIPECFQWLGGTGQWGIPGWTINHHCLVAIIEVAKAFKGRKVLELGTSRGRLTASLATIGCKVTTVDHMDRGAAQNLKGLDVRVIRDDAIHYLKGSQGKFDLVISDLHGNSVDEWKEISSVIFGALKKNGVLVISNYRLNKDRSWKDECGVGWFVDQLPRAYKVSIVTKKHPGVVKITKP
jgi:hypothetical protein